MENLKRLRLGLVGLFSLAFSYFLLGQIQGGKIPGWPWDSQDTVGESQALALTLLCAGVVLSSLSWRLPQSGEELKPEFPKELAKGVIGLRMESRPPLFQVIGFLMMSLMLLSSYPGWVMGGVVVFAGLGLVAYLFQGYSELDLNSKEKVRFILGSERRREKLPELECVMLEGCHRKDEHGECPRYRPVLIARNSQRLRPLDWHVSYQSASMAAKQIASCFAVPLFLGGPDQGVTLGRNPKGEWTAREFSLQPRSQFYHLSLAVWAVAILFGMLSFSGE